MMQFQLKDKLYPIDLDSFTEWVGKWRDSQRCTDGVTIGYGSEDENGHHWLQLTQLGTNLMIEYLVSRGELDRNILLEGAVQYDRKAHCDVICNS